MRDVFNKDVRKLFPKSSTCKKSVSEEGSVIEETLCFSESEESFPNNYSAHDR